MTKILIDTNIFLGFYQAHSDTIKLFQEIKKIKNRLIFSDQIFDEFIRNRDVVLRRLVKDVDKNKLSIPSSSLIQHLEEYSELKSVKSDYEKTSKKLKKRIEKMIEDPLEDPIYSIFIELYQDENVQKIKKDEEIIHLAHCRKLCGNPPISDKKDTIGDEIIWESILSNIDDNLIIVSRDSTYKDHDTFLREEYKNKTNKSLRICEDLSEAFDLIGTEPSDAVKSFDGEMGIIFQYLKDNPPPDIHSLIIKNLSCSIPDSKNILLDTLSLAASMPPLTMADIFSHYYNAKQCDDNGNEDNFDGDNEDDHKE